VCVAEDYTSGRWMRTPRASIQALRGAMQNPTYRAARVRLPFPTTHRLQAQGLLFSPFSVAKPRLPPYRNDGLELVHLQTRFT
jgi:hypothetical protein